MGNHDDCEMRCCPHRLLAASTQQSLWNPSSHGDRFFHKTARGMNCCAELEHAKWLILLLEG